MFVRLFLDRERLFDIRVAANSSIFSPFYLFLRIMRIPYVFASEKFPMNVRSLIIALPHLSIYAAD